MSTIFFIWPLLSFWWTTVLLRQLCEKRLAVLPLPTPPSPPPLPPPPPLFLLCCCCCCCWAAAELLLCCCCCHIRVPHLRVPKKICCASRCQPIFPFFDTRFVFFVVSWNFGDSLIANTTGQSDAGMNLAFFKFDGIIG